MFSEEGPDASQKTSIQLLCYMERPTPIGVGLTIDIIIASLA
jgi:hypothetical protein